MSEPLHITGKGISLRLRMGEGPAQMSGGVGGWEEVSRPGRKALTVHTSQPRITQTVPVLLDGWEAGESVDDEKARVIRLGQKDEQGNPPPVLRLSGPVHMTKLRWVLSDVSWGDRVIRRRDGVLVRQDATLTFEEYVEPDRIRLRKGPRSGNRGGGVGPGDFFPYRSREGDTLARIAARLLGSAHLYKLLANNAGIRDPNKKLPPGTIVRFRGGAGA